MRFFDEFGRGDIRIHQLPLFTMNNEGAYSLSMSNMGFDRIKLASLFTEEQLQKFFSSRFYRRIKNHITPFEFEHLFTHRLPSSSDGRIVLGVIRNHDIWWDETKYDKATDSIVYIGDLANPVDIAMRLFGSDDDPMPQEVIAIGQTRIGFSQFIPMIEMIDESFLEPRAMARAFGEITNFRFGGKREADGRFAENIWIPTAMSMITVDHIYKELVKNDLDTSMTLVWTAAMDLASFRSEGKDLVFLLNVIAGKKLTPKEYLEMCYTSKHKGDEMYALWAFDVDETLWSNV